MHSFHNAPFFLLQCFHAVPFVYSFHVAAFSWCTLFMLQRFWCYTIFMLHLWKSFWPVFFYSFHVALFRCCFSSHWALLILHSSMSHSFHVAAFVSSTFSCCTFSIMHSLMVIFHASLISCCRLLRLLFFIMQFFSCCTLSFLLHFFHVALYQVVLFSCYIFRKLLQSIFVLGII